MTPEFYDRVATALGAIRKTTDFRPTLALVAGTGLAPVLDEIETCARIPYAKIEGFARSTAPSHQGELLFGTLAGQAVVAQSGRFHLYEGWRGDDIVLPVYVLKALGARSYVVTNAAGALNPDYRVGDAVLISDHLNFTGQHPLEGPNDARLGLRFPDMSNVYDQPWSAKALKAAKPLGLALHEGVYAAVHGPEFETSAERRFLRAAGGDLVGMSTVLEAIAASHCQMATLGFSAVTNSATGGPDQQPDTLEEVLKNAAAGGAQIKRILLEMIRGGAF